jgi:hypothetical protein
MTQFAGGDALNDVLVVLDNAMIQDDQLQYQVDTEVHPQIEHWRGGINKILEYFNVGIDYDMILNQAEQNFQKEQQMRDAMAAANGEVTIFLRHAQVLADKALEGERRKMQAMIAAALANGDMSAAETAELIRKLKADFEEQRQLTIEKSRLIATSQQAAGLSMEQQMLLMQTLIERAKMAKAAWDNTPEREVLDTEHARLERMTDKVQGALEQSLLQVSDDADHLNTARRQVLLANNGDLANRTLVASDGNLDAEFRAWKQRLKSRNRSKGSRNETGSSSAGNVTGSSSARNGTGVAAPLHFRRG